MRSVVLSLLLLAMPHLSVAEQQTPPWLQPEVLEAARAIELTQEQMPQFRAAITDLGNNLVSATNRLLRQNNIVDLERRLKTTMNRQFKKLDQQVGTFLTETQQPKYLVYRDKLKSQLAKSTRVRSESSSDSLFETEETLEQIPAARH